VQRLGRATYSSPWRKASTLERHDISSTITSERAEISPESRTLCPCPEAHRWLRLAWALRPEGASRLGIRRALGGAGGFGDGQ
jgi:hypothetical protein